MSYRENMGDSIGTLEEHLPWLQSGGCKKIRKNFSEKTSKLRMERRADVAEVKIMVKNVLEKKTVCSRD